MEQKKYLNKWLIATVTIVLLMLLIFGFWYYRSQRELIRREVENNLLAIASLKQEQIINWRLERLADVSMIMESPLLNETIPRWLAHPQQKDTEQIVARFRLQRYEKYSDISLVDNNGKICLSLSGKRGNASSELRQVLTTAWREHRPMLSDLHDVPGVLPPHIDIVVPLFTSNEETAQPVGAIALQMDADKFLFPLIQSWPVPSRSAETLLIRREGDEVLFLNELRHKTNTTLKLRIPISQADLPAAMAAQGKEGIVQGKDYRGVKVLAALKAIPDTPWFMVAKIDETEAFAMSNKQSSLILLLLLGMVAAIFIAATLVWQRNEKAFYRTLYRTEVDLRRSEAQHQTTLLSIGDGVIVTDREGKVQLLNPVAEQLTGWKKAEAQDRPLQEIFHIVNEETGAAVENPVTKVLQQGVVVGLANHTLLISRQQQKIPIADSGAPIRDENGDTYGVVLVFRDQTVERAAQKALQANEEKYRTLVEQTLEGIVIAVGPPPKLVFANSAFARMCGYSLNELIAMSPAELNELVHPDDRKMFFDRFAERLAGKQPPNRYEFRGLTKDKKTYWLQISSSLIDFQGKPAVQAALTDITERKQATEELAQNHRLLNTLVNSLPDLIYVKDRQSRFLLANEALARSFNADKPEDLLGKTDFDFAPAELAEQYFADEQKIFLSGKPLIGYEETLINKKTGEQKWLLSSKIPFYNEQGELLGLVGMNRDITSRKLTEEALQTLSLRQQALLAAIPDIVMEVDKNKVYRWANQAGLNFFGKDVLGKEASSYFAGEQDTYQAVKPLFNGEEDIIYLESWQRRQDGQKRLLAWWCRVLKDLSGNVIGALSSARDITEQRHAEEVLRTSEAQLSNAMEIAHLGYWEYDVAENVFTFNDHFYSIYRTTAEKVGGYKMTPERYAELFVHPEDRPQVGLETKKAMETTDPHYSRQLEHRMLYADGEDGYVSVRFFIVKDAQGRTIKTYGANQDITERKKAGEQIKRDLQEKTVLLNEIHHRVKNNLQVVASLLNLQSHQLNDQRAVEMFNQSRDRIYMMSRVHEKLYQTENFASIDFKDYLEDIISDMFQSSGLRNRVKLEIEVKNVILGIDDAIPVSLIINELFTNSVKYAFPGQRKGSICLKFSRMNDDSYQLIYQDNGIGVPENIDFDRTETLGLNLVRLLSKQIGGNAVLERGEWTRFTINFLGYGFKKKKHRPSVVQ